MEKTHDSSRTALVGHARPAGQNASDVDPAAVSAAQAAFVSAALGMSWQLAIVVLVPLLGGFALDNVLGTNPLLTLIGLALAAAGTGLIIWKQMRMYSPKITEADIAKAKRIRDKEDTQGDADDQ